VTDLEQLPAAFRRNSVGLEVVPRMLFASRFFHYKPGQHVLFGGPSQHGKTSCAFDLLEHVATVQLPAYFAVSKPEDEVTRRRGTELGYRFVSDWPATRKIGELMGGEKPSGYVIWSKFGDFDNDVARCADVTARLIRDRYTAGTKKQKGIMVMDDTMLKAKVLGLDGDMVTILAMAGAMGLGLWTFVQKVTDSGRTPLWAYSQSEHFFFLHDGVVSAQKTYAEKADMDWRDFAAATGSLEEYQFLYRSRSGYLCVVDAK